ncbi:MAG: DUF11 domain-containing protein [Thermoanaerobaculum sp.]|nr:DUF11 domain-containing protein [Thermoanaerobaculum sp.]MDW7967977.1 DUF11 domain-containing protein [Thermoanaerobaculum sp.]
MRKLLLLGLLVSVPTAVMGQSRVQQGLSDGYGYRMYSQASSHCAYNFLNIDAAGTPLIFSAPYAAPGDPPADDDGGAVVALPQPFPFYGLALSSLVVSVNGYVAFASGLNQEDGRDFSPDALLPAVASAFFPSASPVFTESARLLPFHADLVRSGGSVLTASYPSCPRSSEALGAEPCTVVQWSNLQLSGGSLPLTFQVVLYHQSGQVVFQYAALPPGSEQAATIGWQGPGAHHGAAWSARRVGLVNTGTALCLFAPTFPPGGPQSDLTLDLWAAPPDPIDAHPFPVEVWVSAQGPSPAAGVTVSGALPPGLAAVADPCTLFAGGWSVGSLTVHGTATCSVTLQASPSFAGGTLTVTAASSTSDPNPTNNTAQLELQAADDGDGVAAAVEDSYPGGDGFPVFRKGDGNGDGIPDRNQRHVATLPLAIGKGWITVEATGCPQLTQVFTVTEAGSGTPDPLYDFPLGLVGFSLPCPQGQIKLLFHQVGTPSVTYRALRLSTWQTLAVTRIRDRFVWGYTFDLSDGGPGDLIPGDGTLRHLGGSAEGVSIPGRR